MTRSTELGSTRLTCRGTGRLEFQILAGDSVLGTLNCREDWTARFTSSSAEENLYFRKVGLIAPRVVVRSKGSPTPDATLYLAWRGGGSITLSRGDSFKLIPKGFWRSEWVLKDSKGLTIFTIRPDFKSGQPEANIEIPPAHTLPRSLPLLATLCWYAVLLVSYEGGQADEVAATLASLSI